MSIILPKYLTKHIFIMVWVIFNKIYIQMAYKTSANWFFGPSVSKRLFILPPFEPFDVFVLLLRMVDYPQIPNCDPHFEQNRPQSRRGEPRRPFCVSLLCNVWWQTITWLLLLFLYYILALRVVVVAAEYVCISIQSCTHWQNYQKDFSIFNLLQHCFPLKLIFM